MASIPGELYVYAWETMEAVANNSKRLYQALSDVMLWGYAREDAARKNRIDINDLQKAIRRYYARCKKYPYTGRMPQAS